MTDETLIDDQYQFVMGIASGSSSTVEEVVEKSSGRHLAMKRLKQGIPEFKENKAQLKRESEVLKNLDHPLIVKFVKYSSNRDHTYLLMEHFRASNLKLQIKADLNKVQLRIRHLLEGVCSALSHVHQRGYVHRDIKPDNVLMNKAGEVRLCDFSLSSKQATGIGKVFAGKLKVIQGTRTYIAPETIRKRQPTFQTDMYSLGILFFELLTGKTPFQAPTPEELLQKHLTAEAPNPSEFNPNVSPEMDRVVAKLLKKKPADRPGTVDEVLAELKRIRIFKEDVVDAEAAKKANEDANALAQLSEVRLDSRADAKLKQMIETNPEFAKKYMAEMQEKDNRKKVEQDKQRKRIEAAESKGKKTPDKGKAAPAPTAAPQTIAVPVPVPMPMPGFAPGYPGYPPGYGGYPQAQMPMMPMQPQMGMPGQYLAQPQMGYPQAQLQQPTPQQPQQGPPQRMQTAEPPRTQATAPPQAAQAAPPVRMATAEPPVRMATEAPPVAATQAPAKRPVANPPQGAKPTARQVIPAQATQKSPAAQPPAKSVGPLPGRTPVKPVPPPEVATDLDFMTDLPDVL